MANPKYYVTTPAHDPASTPTAWLYTAILGDAIARHRHMCGFDVVHFVGTHTSRVSLPYSPEGALGKRIASTPPNQKRFDKLAAHADILCDTISSDEHTRAVQTLLRRTMHRSRLAIYKANYQGWYCIHDQIDIGDSLEPANCSVCGCAGKMISEERYFFRLSAFHDRLVGLYKYRPEFLQPQFRSREIESLLQKGVKDIPISRRSTGCGVPWPDDPKHTVSPCYSELVRYLSGIGFGKDGYGSDQFTRYWPANLHVIGKEQLICHALYWPALLIAADLHVPRHIFAHGTLCFDQEARNGAHAPERLLHTFGSDALRYCLLREVPFEEDARLSFEKLVERYNTDLAGGFGKIVDRILTSLAEHCDGRIPNRSLGRSDQRMEIASTEIRAEARFLFDNNNFSEGLKTLWSLLTIIDKALTDSQPRESVRESKDNHRLTDVLHDACQSLAWILILLHAILPRTTDAIWRTLGQTTDLRDQGIDETPWGCLMPGTPLAKLGPLFPAIRQNGAVPGGCRDIRHPRHNQCGPAQEPTARQPVSDQKRHENGVE